VRPVTGVPLITGCNHMLNAAGDVVRLIMQQAAPGSGAVQQRLVLAPWLALRGRCILALARALRAVQSQGPPADLRPLISCIQTLLCSNRHVYDLLHSWNDAFSSSTRSSASSNSSRGSASGTGFCLHSFAQQVQADTDFAAGCGRTVAAACAAATSKCAYSPEYAAFDVDHLQLHSLRVPTNDLRRLLTATAMQLARLDAGGTVTASSGSGASDCADDDVLAHSIQRINSSRSCEECWRSCTACSAFTASCEALEQLGLLLCNQLPMPWLCNNPHCSNLSGVSELQLVGGEACVCGRCWVAR
jgi:hypothetical protein